MKAAPLSLLLMALASCETAPVLPPASGVSGTYPSFVPTDSLIAPASMTPPKTLLAADAARLAARARALADDILLAEEKARLLEAIARSERSR